MVRRLSLALVAACSSSSAPPSYAPPPRSVVVEDPGPIAIRREVFVIDGAIAPPNPNGARATPLEQNKVRVVRYRVDADPPKPAKAIVVMMPGLLGGAGSLDGLARAIVRRSGEAALEAWAIDRRSNLLEDTHGLDVAEVRKDASLATRYYFDLEPIEGKSFGGFLQSADLPWASEWGLAVTLGDLRAALALVPERGARVILLGHSLGAAIAEEYAAWDFDGAPGAREIAGLVLVDGASGGEGKPSALDRDAYENGKPMAPGAFGPQPGVVKDIRAGLTLVSIPFVGTKALAVSEYVAISARASPREVRADGTRDSLLAVFLGKSPIPAMTNRAAFGFAFDDESCALQIAAVSCGQGTGGAITPYESAFGATLVQPSDGAATYDWIEHDVAREATSIDDAARAWYEGPQLNFAEWYFPQRLTVDAQAARSLNITDDDWRLAVYGLRAKHGARIDVPVLAAGSAVAKPGAYEDLRALLPPIGQGRPKAGAPRTDPAAFRVIDEPALTHIDWLVGADVPSTAVARFYDAVAALARDATAPGGVVIPIR